MALSNAERQRRKRQKAKDDVKTAPDLTPVNAADFPAFIRAASEAARSLKPKSEELKLAGQMLGDAGAVLGTIGADFFPDVALSTDTDPEWSADWGIPNKGALGRAERHVEVYIAAAQALAIVINTFKLQQVAAAKARLLKRDMSTADAKRRATAEAIRLDKIESRLRKEVRHSFHAIAVKDEV